MSAQISKLRTTIYAVFFLFAIGVVAYQLYQRYKLQHPALPEFGTVPTFTLTTEDHRTFSHEDFKGKVTITDFIFTTCAGPCPIMSGQMQQLQATLQKTSIQFVSFSVDPETDTPEVLTEYANRFGAIKGQWIFLTGAKQIIYEAIRSGFHLAIEDDENAIAHSTKFVLVDKEGQIRGYYDIEDDDSMKKLVEDAKSLL